MSAFLLVAGLAFAQAKDEIDQKLKEFADGMKAAKTDGERLSLMDTLAATHSIKAASKLTGIITGPYSDAVRAGAADAVAKTGEVKAGAGLQSVLSSFGGLLQSEIPSRSGDQKVAEAVVRAIGDLKDHSAVPQLTHMLISANIPLMGECVRSLGKIRDAACMDGLLKLHYAANAPEGGGATNPRKPLAPHTLAALRRITGQQLTTPDEWNKWWRANGGSFRPPPENP
jgi:HEAT repeat protein